MSLDGPLRPPHPSLPRERLPLVPGIYSDIGDEQNLDESHSTFSGHVANIMDILRELEPGAMVLLDELAVGTDPLQGAALAQPFWRKWQLIRPTWS